MDVYPNAQALFLPYSILNTSIFQNLKITLKIYQMLLLYFRTVISLNNQVLVLEKQGRPQLLLLSYIFVMTVNQVIQLKHVGVIQENCSNILTKCEKTAIRQMPL